MRVRRFELVIFNDEDHTFRYVHDLLVDALGLSSSEALHFVHDIHGDGQAGIVLDEVRARRAHEQILARGPDPLLARSATSLIAGIGELDEHGFVGWLVPPTRLTPSGRETLGRADVAHVQRESLLRSFRRATRNYASSCGPSCATSLGCGNVNVAWRGSPRVG